MKRLHLVTTLRERKALLLSFHICNITGKGKVVPVLFSLTEHHAMKAYCGSGVIDPSILDLGTRWR
jgi:hypothetical protein